LDSQNWINKKQDRCPNLLAYIKRFSPFLELTSDRFNMGSNWIMRAILSQNTLQGRTDMMTTVIKVAKVVQQIVLKGKGIGPHGKPKWNDVDTGSLRTKYIIWKVQPLQVPFTD